MGRQKTENGGRKVLLETRISFYSFNAYLARKIDHGPYTFSLCGRHTLLHIDTLHPATEMKDNINTRVSGKKVVLVPFQVAHAPVYMRWMQDDYVKEMTATEDLELNSLSQAEAFCLSIEDDPNNCTFLICDNTDPSSPQLAGDINFFLSTDETSTGVAAEVNIMIGEASARRKGLAQEALLLGMRYVVEKLKVSILLARISDTNVASFNLFQNKLNWPIESHSDVFSETTFKMVISPDFEQELVASTPDFSVTDDYESNKVV